MGRSHKINIVATLRLFNMPITESSIDLAEKAYSRMNLSQKKRLLKNLGHSTTFAQTKSMKELVARGGGFAARDILRTVNQYKKKNPHLNRIIWN